MGGQTPAAGARHRAKGMQHMWAALARRLGANRMPASSFPFVIAARQEHMREETSASFEVATCSSKS